MAKLLEIKEDLRRRWHQDRAEQGEWLGTVVRGFFAYHAVPTGRAPRRGVGAVGK
jgi:RNA-directed DNA polymerase